LLSDIKNRKLRFLAYSILSALLLILSYEPIGFFPLSFFAFVPLLILEKESRESSNSNSINLILFSSLTFILWNTGCIWWIWNASEGGAIAAIIINSIPMLVPFYLLNLSAYRNGKPNYNLFIFSWIAIEILQFNWDLAFPWLILGNVFSNFTQGVQWYEYTGVLGGSFLILSINIKLFNWIINYLNGNFVGKELKLFNIIFIWIFCPFLGSYFVLDSFKEYKKIYPSKTVNTLVVQPNIDPYTEKFNAETYPTQLAKMIVLAESKINPQTQLVVFPETALVGGLYEQELENDALIQICKSFIEKHPGINLLSGADTYKTYPKDQMNIPITARFYPSIQQYIDAYNTALFIQPGAAIQIYHKNKMVPGVEKMPYPLVFGFLEKMAIDLGGTSGSLGSDGESKVFESKHHLKIAPIICYESVFPDFVSSYKSKGADLFCIVTNDAWWGNTPGYKQHLSYAKLRAIENRTPIVRCANTGISGFISDEGEITQQSNWWEPCAIEAKVSMSSYLTFYTQYASLLHGICLVVFALQVFKLWFKPKI